MHHRPSLAACACALCTALAVAQELTGHGHGPHLDPDRFDPMPSEGRRIVALASATSTMESPFMEGFAFRLTGTSRPSANTG